VMLHNNFTNGVHQSHQAEPGIPRVRKMLVF
jgi:hypothetical protein